MILSKSSIVEGNEPDPDAAIAAVKALRIENSLNPVMTPALCSLVLQNDAVSDTTKDNSSNQIAT